MSIVAWDGRRLAADQQATRNGRLIHIKKIVSPQPGLVLAWCGDHEQGLTLRDWYLAGADPAQWPAFQTVDHFTDLIVVADGLCWCYEALPVAQHVQDSFAAWGDGASLAIGAMAMGANAEAAVEVACRFNIYCSGEPVVF